MQRGVQPGTTMHRYKVLGKKGEGTFSEVRCAGGVLCGMRGGGGREDWPVSSDAVSDGMEGVHLAERAGWPPPHHGMEFHRVSG